ncbi:hypothetical protein ACFL5G_01780 [Candidatus Margulisiibacteriota bacterium]
MTPVTKPDGVKNLDQPITTTPADPAAKASKPSWKADDKVIKELDTYAQLNDEPIDAQLAELYRKLCLLGFTFKSTLITEKDVVSINCRLVEFLREIAKAEDTALTMRKNKDDAKGTFEELLEEYKDIVTPPKITAKATYNLFGSNTFDGLKDLDHAWRTLEVEVQHNKVRGTLGTVEDLDDNGTQGELMDQLLVARNRYYSFSAFNVKEDASEIIKEAQDKGRAETDTAEKNTEEVNKEENGVYAYHSSIADSDAAKMTEAEQFDYLTRWHIMNFEPKKTDTAPPPENDEVVDNTDVVDEKDPLKDDDSLIPCTENAALTKETFIVKNGKVYVQMGDSGRQLLYEYTLKTGEELVKDKVFIGDCPWGKRPYLVVKSGDEYKLIRLQGVVKGKHKSTTDPAQMYYSLETDTENDTCYVVKKENHVPKKKPVQKKKVDPHTIPPVTKKEDPAPTLLKSDASLLGPMNTYNPLNPYNPYNPYNPMSSPLYNSLLNPKPVVEKKVFVPLNPVLYDIAPLSKVDLQALGVNALKVRK